MTESKPPAVRSVTIEGFRGVRAGVVGELSPLSVLVGPNNCGKSTALEAIAMTGLGLDARAAFELLIRRGGSTLHALRRVFHAKPEARIQSEGLPGLCASVKLAVAELDLDAQHAVKTAGQLTLPALRASSRYAFRDYQGGGTTGSASEVVFDHQGAFSHRSPAYFSQPDLCPMRFVDVEAVRATGSLEDAYTRVEQAGRLQDVIRALRGSMPGLTDLRILKVESDFVLHTFTEGRPPIPAFLAGDGFKRFLSIASAAGEAADGVLLLEEPESFQHPRYLRELAALLRATAARGAQVVLNPQHRAHRPPARRGGLARRRLADGAPPAARRRGAARCRRLGERRPHAAPRARRGPARMSLRVVLVEGPDDVNALREIATRHRALGRAPAALRVAMARATPRIGAQAANGP